MVVRRVTSTNYRKFKTIWLCCFVPFLGLRVPRMPAISKAISCKRCTIAGKLVLITDKKLYMSFRLVPKLVTLNDLEGRNGPYSA